MRATPARRPLLRKIEVGRAGILLLVLGAIVLGKLAQEAYDWYAYGEERARLARLEPELTEIGLEVVLSQLRADSLRGVIDAKDRELAEKRTALEAYDRYQQNGRLSPALFRRYKRDLANYNAHVEARNGLLDEWRAAIGRNEKVVAAYNELADRIREIAGSMGEAYYPLPTPAEIASARGISVPVDQLPN